MTRHRRSTTIAPIDVQSLAVPVTLAEQGRATSYYARSRMCSGISTEVDFRPEGNCTGLLCCMPRCLARGAGPQGGMARRLNQQCRPAVRTHHTSHSADRSPSGQVPIINSVTSYNTVTSANTFQSLTDFTHHIAHISRHRRISIVFLVHYSGSVSGHEVSVNWTMFSSVV